MKKKDILSRLITPTGTKGCASHVGAGCTFCPGWCYQTRDKRAPPFVPDWRSRLENWDNSGFPIVTNQRFCSSVQVARASSGFWRRQLIRQDGQVHSVNHNWMVMSLTNRASLVWQSNGTELLLRSPPPGANCSSSMDCRGRTGGGGGTREDAVGRAAQLVRWGCHGAQGSKCKIT